MPEVSITPSNLGSRGFGDGFSGPYITSQIDRICSYIGPLLNMEGNVSEDMTERRKTYADFILFLGEVHE